MSIFNVMDEVKVDNIFGGGDEAAQTPRQEALE
jgi:hypothetical protein